MWSATPCTRGASGCCFMPNKLPGVFTECRCRKKLESNDATSDIRCSGCTNEVFFAENHRLVRPQLASLTSCGDLLSKTLAAHAACSVPKLKGGIRMTRKLIVLLALCLVPASTGCVCGGGLLCNKSACDACDGGGCNSCGLLGDGGGGPGAHLGRRADCFQPGPPAAQVTYPYYTVKGPRDFFLDAPVSHGL